MTRMHASVCRGLARAQSVALLLCLTVGCSEDEPAATMMSDSASPVASDATDTGVSAGDSGGSRGAPSVPAANASMDGGSEAPGADAAPTATLDAGLPVDARATPDAQPVADCTPSKWMDPGTVANPKVVAVASDAGDAGLWGKSKGLDALGYAEEEFFFTGTSPAYTSRVVVHRPKDAAKFSGTVFMEWYNVSGGIDFAPLWAVSREYFAREGHVHVGVSAQAVGANALKENNAVRYAPINHPGDDAANAIFAQAAMAIRKQSELLLGPCMPVDHVLALGQSQSAGMLATYIDNAQAKDRIYDGHMVHSGFGAPSSMPTVPVFVVNTMNEGDGTVVDQPNMVEWEVAGASHNDENIMKRGNEELAEGLGVVTKCVSPLNNFPAYWVYNAALDWLHKWARNGQKPPKGAPFKSAMGGLARDQFNNVLGGVRIQDIDVPIASYTMENGPEDVFDLIGHLACGLGGSTKPLTPEQLLMLYPTHESYVQKYTQAADKAVSDGFLLDADRKEAIRKAQSAPIPK
jgi:hypothetical protein